MQQNEDSPLYTKDVVEFVTVAKEYCVQLEQAKDQKQKSFMERMSKIAPLLYLKASMLPDLYTGFGDDLESFVTEEEYESVRQSLSALFGEIDDYLDTQVTDMQYSESALPTSISENMSDVYQDLKDMLCNFQSANHDVMVQSVAECKENFKNHWGQKLLSALGALHKGMYRPDSSVEYDSEEF